jgi:hypothetical protein
MVSLEGSAYGVPQITRPYKGLPKGVDMVFTSHYVYFSVGCRVLDSVACEHAAELYRADDEDGERAHRADRARRDAAREVASCWGKCGRDVYAELETYL